MGKKRINIPRVKDPLVGEMTRDTGTRGERRSVIGGLRDVEVVGRVELVGHEHIGRYLVRQRNAVGLDRAEPMRVCLFGPTRRWIAL